jgi:hypothetical protein
MSLKICITDDDSCLSELLEVAQEIASIARIGVAYAREDIYDATSVESGELCFGLFSAIKRLIQPIDDYFYAHAWDGIHKENSQEKKVRATK